MCTRGGRRSESTPGTAGMWRNRWHIISLGFEILLSLQGYVGYLADLSLYMLGGTPGQLSVVSLILIQTSGCSLGVVTRTLPTSILMTILASNKKQYFSNICVHH